VGGCGADMIGVVARRTLAGVGIGLLALCLSACSSPASTPSGALKGRLMEDGGPALGLPRSARGTITVTGHGVSKSVRVGATGLFTFVLPSGSYTVSGSLAGNESPCSTTPTGEVKVVARRTIVVHVFCSIR
jgi:hypothetical protein